MAKTTDKLNMGDLESELMDANLMAKLTREFAARGLGFENAKVPELSLQDVELLYFALCQTSHLIKNANDIFHGRDEQADV